MGKARRDEIGVRAAAVRSRERDAIAFKFDARVGLSG